MFVSGGVLALTKMAVECHRKIHETTVDSNNFYKMTNKIQLCRIMYCSLSVLHVSSGIIARHQEQLNCIYSFWFYSRVSLSTAVMAQP
jgi:hypothetical protein